MKRPLWHGMLLSLALLAGGADVSPAHAAGQEAVQLNALQLKAAFIFRFFQLTQWPPPPREVTWCVAGGPALQEALRAVLQTTPGGAGVHLLQVNEPQRVPQCQLLVLSLESRTELRRWHEVLSDDPVLVIGDNAESFRNGAVIALVVEPNGLAFRINQTEARRRGLALSYQMLKLAREVR